MNSSLPKDDKDFLKMNKFLTNQSDIDIILNSHDSYSTT